MMIFYSIYWGKINQINALQHLLGEKPPTQVNVVQYLLARGKINQINKTSTLQSIKTVIKSIAVKVKLSIKRIVRC